MKKFLLFILFLIVVILIVISINTMMFSSKQVAAEGQRRNFPVDSASVARLKYLIQLPTISYDENQEKGTYFSETDRNNNNNGFFPKHDPQTAFVILQVALRTFYPTVFEKLELKVINNYSMLMHWKTNSKKNPAILYAHLDVVPADTSVKWQHPPFSGDDDAEFIYGRGAIDDKGAVIGIMEAVESLLKKGFTPSRDIYIAFGHDEEAGGEEGAKEIAKYLQEIGVEAEFLLDEGGLIAVDMVPFVKRPVAMVFTSEKGYMTMELSVKSNGGHSSFPPAEAPIEILSKAIQKIHDNPSENRMTESVNNFMDYTGPEMKFPFKALFANRWLFESIIFGEYEKIPSASAMIRTTSVATVINGGKKENAIPSEVNAKINFRLLPGDESHEVYERIKKLIDDERISIRVADNTEEASAVSSSDSESFKLLSSTIVKVFPDAIVAPSLLIAQTDSRHFRKVTQNIYRFLPFRMTSKILDTMHGTNEKIGKRELMEGVEFYRELIMGI